MAKQKYEKFGSRNFHPSGIGDTVGDAEGDLMFFGVTDVTAGKVYVLTTQECEGEDAPVYVSDSAGILTASVPTGSADYVRKVGHVLGQNRMWFNPDNTIIKIAT